MLAKISGAGFANLLAQSSGASVRFTPADLSSVGDNAYGGVVQVAASGQPTVYFVLVLLSSGRAVDLVFAGALSQPQAADVLNLAQITANRLDAGLAG